MFEFFQNLQLVTTSDEGVTAKKSTPEEWHEKGTKLRREKRWQAASQAFVNAEDFSMAGKCNARVQLAKANMSNSVTELLKAAKLCLDCDMAEEAAIALENAEEFELLTELKTKMHTKCPVTSAWEVQISGKRMDRGSKRLIANHHQTRPHQVRQIKYEVEFKVAEKYKS